MSVKPIYVLYLASLTNLTDAIQDRDVDRSHCREHCANYAVLQDFLEKSRRPFSSSIPGNLTFSQRCPSLPMLNFWADPRSTMEKHFANFKVQS